MIWSSSRTNEYPMCTIGVSQSGQNRIPSGTVQSTLLMGRDSYRSLRTDLGFDVRVWVFTSVILAGPVSSSSSAALSAFGSFSLEMPNSFRFISTMVSVRFAILLFSCPIVFCSSSMVLSLSLMTLYKNCIISSELCVIIHSPFLFLFLL